MCKGQTNKNLFKDVISTNKVLDVLHMDLFGPSRTASLARNLYALVIVDDFSRYTWTLFLASKNDAYKAFKKLAKVLHNENENRIKHIRSDHGESFKMQNLIGIVKNMGSHIAILLLGHPNKMV